MISPEAADAVARLNMGLRGDNPALLAGLRTDGRKGVEQRITQLYGDMGTVLAYFRTHSRLYCGGLGLSEGRARLALNVLELRGCVQIVGKKPRSPAEPINRPGEFEFQITDAGYEVLQGSIKPQP